MSEVLQVSGCVAASVLAAAALTTRSRDLRAAAVLGSLAIAAALVVGEAWDDIDPLRDRPPLFAAAILAGAAALSALAALIRRVPLALPLLLVGALPFRVPIGVGTEDANLLLPLYLVIGAGAIAAALTAREVGGERDGGGPRPLRWALAAAVVVYAAQSAYSADIGFAARNVSFFLVPFAAMFVLLTDIDWTPRVLGLSFAVIVGSAVLFSVVGIGQAIAGEIFWNPALELSNDFHFYFRVNSLFWDPNIFGRYLAVVAVVVVAAVLWARDSRSVAIAAGVLAVILTGMVLGFSQTSFIALLVGIGVVCGLRYNGVAAAVATPAVLVLAFAAVIFIGGTSEAEDSAEEVSSGRSTLIEGGVDLFTSKPLGGHGSASFSDAFNRQEGLGPNVPTISHNETVTVAAEQGVVGLVVYAAVVVAAIMALLTGMRAIAPGLGAPSSAIGDPRRSPGAPRLARVALAGAFAAILVHTVGYGAFLTDPITWAILAIGCSLAAGSGRDGSRHAEHHT